MTLIMIEVIGIHIDDLNIRLVACKSLCITLPLRLAKTSTFTVGAPVVRWEFSVDARVTFLAFSLPFGIHEAWLVTSTAYKLEVYNVFVHFRSEV